MMNPQPNAATVTRLPERTGGQATGLVCLPNDHPHELRPIANLPGRGHATCILVIVYADEASSMQVARVLCHRQGWPMAEVRAASSAKATGLFGRMAARIGQHGTFSYAGPSPDSFETVLLIAPASIYRAGGVMCKFLATLQESSVDVILLTVQEEVPCHEGAQRVAQWTGRYPLLAMWIRPIELDCLGSDSRIQAFAMAVRAMKSMPLI